MSDYDEWDSWDEDCESEEQEVPGFKFNPATGERESTTYSSKQEKRWVECYELIAAGLFKEAREKWETMIAKDGPKADTTNFQAQINAGLKASMPLKSEAAERCEAAAKEAFDELRAQVEAQGKDTTHQLLTPKTHLTGECWKSFKAYVQSFAGWQAVRRAATEEEKQQYQEKRKAKTYFITVMFTTPRPAKAASQP